MNLEVSTCKAAAAAAAFVSSIGERRRRSTTWTWPICGYLRDVINAKKETFEEQIASSNEMGGGVFVCAHLLPKRSTG